MIIFNIYIMLEKKYKHIKTFKEYRVNETLDMFMMPVDPMRGYGDMWDDFKNSMKKSYTDFIKKVKKEGKETQEAYELVVKASKGEVELSEGQKDKIWKQLGDIFKSIGLGVISVIPGSVIILMLIKFLKLEKYVLPSSFK